MKIYLSGGQLRTKHIKYLFTYYGIINPVHRFGTFKDFKRFVKRITKTKEK